MRFLHTSDWHLGRAFHGVGLLPAQELFLDDLVATVEREQVEAVLVSGDVYDRALPPPDAVRLLSRTLGRLRRAGAQVVLSAGNHDSPARLGFADEVLAAAGVHVRTTADSLTEPVRIGGVEIFPVPYLEPAFAADRLGAGERSHAGVLRAVTDRIADARSGDLPSVVMAHVFAAGATTTDSERDVSVGGLGVVPAEVFDAFDYAALGHLHRPQQLSERVRYSGSPVAMSFSEAGRSKSSLLVDLDEHGLAVRELPAPVLRPLARLRGSLEQLLDDPALADHADSWVEATLTEHAPRAMERLRTRFPHCLRLEIDAPSRQGDLRSYADRVRGRTDLQLCCDFVEHVLGRDADESEQELLREAIDGAAVQRRGADRETSGAERADDAGRGTTGAA